MSTKSHPGRLHEYAPRLVAFEFTNSPTTKPHKLIFIGGLTDGLCTVPYIPALAKALESTEWTVWQAQLTSSFGGWGVGSLDRDIQEIGQCVSYIRDLTPSPGKVVVMGHSTGSQDVLHYLHSPNPLTHNPIPHGNQQYLIRPELDGAILQAPVSDREALLAEVRKPGFHGHELRGAYDQLVDSSRRMPCTDDKTDAILPMNLTNILGLPVDHPVSARRFFSLASPDSPENPAEDDLFSSDLTDERLQETFGAIASQGLLRSKLLVLHSGKDEFVAPLVDKEALMERWRKATEAGGAGKWDQENSGIIPGASHNVSDEGQDDLVARVTRYLNSI